MLCNYDNILRQRQGQWNCRRLWERCRRIETSLSRICGARNLGPSFGFRHGVFLRGHVWDIVLQQLLSSTKAPSGKDDGCLKFVIEQSSTKMVLTQQVGRNWRFLMFIRYFLRKRNWRTFYANGSDVGMVNANDRKKIKPKCLNHMCNESCLCFTKAMITC